MALRQLYFDSIYIFCLNNFGYYFQFNFLLFKIIIIWVWIKKKNSCIFVRKLTENWVYFNLTRWVLILRVKIENRWILSWQRRSLERCTLNVLFHFASRETEFSYKSALTVCHFYKIDTVMKMTHCVSNLWKWFQIWDLYSFKSSHNVDGCALFFNSNIYIE